MNLNPKYELTGKTIGRLHVEKYLFGGKWVCKCECGKFLTVKTHKLVVSKYLSCPNCKGIEPPPEIMKPYMIRNLTTNRNTVIATEVFDRYGEDVILDELRKHGFDCEMRVRVGEYGCRTVVVEMIE